MQQIEETCETLLHREDKNPLIEWEGKEITVDQTAKKYVEYFVERFDQADQLQELIVAAKQYNTSESFIPIKKLVHFVR